MNALTKPSIAEPALAGPAIGGPPQAADDPARRAGPPRTGGRRPGERRRTASAASAPLPSSRPASASPQAAFQRAAVPPAASAAVLAAVLVAFLATVWAAPTAMAQVDLQSKPFSQAESFLEERQRLDDADDSSWLPFVDSDREDILQSLEGYWEGALKALAGDEVIALKDRIKSLQAKNKELELKIGDYELQRAGAPGETKFYEVWKSSRSDYSDKIAGARRQIEANQREIRDLMGQIKSRLAAQGVALSDDQIRGIFMTVSGVDQLEAMVVLKNLYALSDTLKGLITSTSNLSVNKRYYAIFYLAAEAHYFQLRRNLERIDSVYLPRLEFIRRENSALMDQTRELARSKPQYESNLAAQKVTEEVAVKFQELLIRQKDIIAGRLETLDEILLYTINTYRTVTLASSLSDSMDESLNNLAALLNMPVVPPMAFESNLEAKFLELSDMLAVE